jgi:single-stranded-DNA-specific exonuclease
MAKQWTLRPQIGNSLSEQLLLSRGLDTAEAVDRFLNPDYERDLHDPYLMLGMSQAVERINQAVRVGEKIVIFADYDADGVPGAAVLCEFFKKIGHEAIDVYIPDRHNEAYGLNPIAVRQLAEQGMKLLITVDCGIASLPEAKLARDLGVDLIITDHHLVPGEMPPALAILDSKQEGDPYPYNMLCGAGVAFKLVQALIKKGKESPSTALGTATRQLPGGWEKWLLDLVAIATISDMVPLDGENRTLSYFGLKVLRQTRRPGLAALYRVLGLSPAHLTEDDIGFSISPRLNSASRMSHASQAFELLTTADPLRADTIARHLEEKNSERRDCVSTILETIEERYQLTEPPALLVAGDPNWSLGVLGLTAARVVERYSCPVFLWGKNGNGEIKGSCRSDGTVNMVELMKAANTLSTAVDGEPGFFNNFGGHVMAGGFSLVAEREEALELKLMEAYATMPKDLPVEELWLDAELTLDQVSEETYHQIASLAPFGIGNPKPTFLFKDLTVLGVRHFGNGSAHLELKFSRENGTQLAAIGFFRNDEVRIGEKLDLVVTIEKSYFRYKPELRLRIVDIVPLDNL